MKVPTPKAFCLAVGAAVCTLAPLAQAPGACPPVLAGLMPKDAVKVAGQLNSAGEIALGFAAGELPFENVCANQTTKYPGRISLDVKHYGGEAAQLLAMQIDSVEQQVLQSKRQEFEKARGKLQSATPKLDSVGPLKEEAAAGGTLLYYDYSADCSEGVKRSKPSVQLLAVAHTGTTALTLEIQGHMTAEAARAAALQVLANFAKADFGKAVRGR